MPTAIEFNHVSKQYRLGLVSTKTLSHDLQRWWTMNIRGKEDPYLKIGETNDRATKGESDYVWALKDIDFKVEQGDVVGIIGKNGAGKSTLLKLLSKVTGPTTGSIKARGRIGALLEVGTGFHPEMTGRENIFLNGAILGMSKQEIAAKLDEIVDFSGCERYLDTPVKRYSSGMMVRLGFAVAAHLDPEILVVDEVLSVGDAEFQKKAIGKMQDVSKEEGRTVLFVSHNMDSILNLCNYGILIQNGSIVYSGDVKSTVTQYLADGHNSSHYLCKNEKNEIFTHEAYFGGNGKNPNGMFSMDESIIFQFTIKKKENCFVNPNTVVGICLKTARQYMISITELSLKDLVDKGELSFKISYPNYFLMPGDYLIDIDIHIPNVCYLDRCEALKFTIFDNGTEYLKYPGANNGIVYIRPDIELLLQ